VEQAVSVPGTWSPTASMADQRTGHTVTLLLNGQVLAVGGSYGGPDTGFQRIFLRSAELYYSLGFWTSTGALTTSPRMFHTATLVGNNVLVAGGIQEANGSGLDTAELFDPGTGTWTATGNMRTGRTFHTATLLPNKRVLVAGGYSTSSTNLSAVLTAAEVYDEPTGTWMATGSMAKARVYHIASLLPNAQALITGGYSWSSTSEERVPPDPYFDRAGSGASNIVEKTAELYNFATGTWTTTGSMEIGRQQFAAAGLQNGQVLAVGGYPGGETWADRTAELYTP
jgi:N-acetylneuraminic acid mutarotase